MTAGGTPPARGARARRPATLVLVGVLGGLLSGLFGVGGGIVMVPLLTLLAGMDQRRATATSLVAIVPTSIVGAITYGLAGHVDVVAGVAIAAGGIGGSLIGARLLRTLPLGWLRWLFVALLIVAGIRLVLDTPTRGGAIHDGWGAVAGLVLVGLAMGVASGLFGIGGGVIVVPALVTLFGAGDLLAKGTSLLAMVPAAASGTGANLRARLVSLADGLVVGVPAALASVGGTALAFLLPPRESTFLFGVLIVAAVAQTTRAALRGR